VNPREILASLGMTAAPRSDLSGSAWLIGMTVTQLWCDENLGFAEAVEEVIEEDAEDGVDDAGFEEAGGEPGLRLR
jgi:hypothetical protein